MTLASAVSDGPVQELHTVYDDAETPHQGAEELQDPLERRGYHTNMDTFDHLHEPDLIQSAIVIASLVAQAAMSDEAVPRSLLMTARGPRE